MPAREKPWRAPRHHLLAGFGAALATIGCGWLGSAILDDPGMALAVIPLAALIGLLIARGGSQDDAWWLRLLGGGIGTIVSAVAGLAAMLLVKAVGLLPVFPDSHGADVWVLVLMVVAGVTGGLAATPLRFQSGVAVAGGFAGSALVCWIAHALIASHAGLSVGMLENAGMAVVGTVVGAAMGVLVRRFGPTERRSGSAGGR